MSEKVLHISTPLTRFESTVDLAKHIFNRLEKGKEVLPQMICQAEDKSLLIVGVPDLGDRENGGRERTLNVMREINIAHNVSEYCIFHEAYFVKSKSKEGMENDKSYVGRLHEHPDRVEGLVVMQVNKDTSRLKIFEIKQNKDGTRSLGEDLWVEHKDSETSEDRKVEGDFAFLGPWHTVTKGSIERNRELLLTSAKATCHLEKHPDDIKQDILNYIKEMPDDEIMEKVRDGLKNKLKNFVMKVETKEE